MKPDDYSLFWVVEKVGIKMSTSFTTGRLLVAALVSATVGGLLFVASAFMPQDGSGYAPAISIAIVCATAFVAFFIAFLVASTPRR